jgi:hypothetical protein
MTVPRQSSEDWLSFAEGTCMRARSGVDSVREEVVTRAQRLAGYRLVPSAPVALRDLDRASVVLKPGPWAIACRINGVSSAQDLAGQCGLPLYETIEGVGELLQAGMCTLIPAIPGAAAAAAVTQSVTRPAPRSPETLPALPRRDPEAWVVRDPEAVVVRPRPVPAGERAAERTPRPERPEWPEHPEWPGSDADILPPPPELLRRVLDGLRKLS